MKKGGGDKNRNMNFSVFHRSDARGLHYNKSQPTAYILLYISTLILGFLGRGTLLALHNLSHVV